MNFARTCHQAFSTVITKTRLGGHKLSPAEDIFFTTAQQRLEESARMLAAMRRAASMETNHAMDPFESHVLLRLDGHRISRYTGAARVAQTTPYAPEQSQETHDVTHAA